MSSKEQILAAVRKNKPSEKGLPDLLSFPSEDDLVGKYIKSIHLNGGSVEKLESISQGQSFIEENFAEGIKTVSLLDGIIGNVDIQRISDPHGLADVELAVVRGSVGVAENAAIWISEKDLVHRVLPFITQHLIIVLDADQLVGNMHEAYQKINFQEEGFGVFIAGPSKTADIEQALVIGAHGARSLTVFILD